MKHYVIKPNTKVRLFDVGLEPHLITTTEQFVMDSTWLIDEYNNILLFNHKEPKINCFEVQKEEVEIQEFCDCFGIELNERIFCKVGKA